MSTHRHIYELISLKIPVFIQFIRDETNTGIQVTHTRCIRQSLGVFKQVRGQHKKAVLRITKKLICLIFTNNSDLKDFEYYREEITKNKLYTCRDRGIVEIVQGTFRCTLIIMTLHTQTILNWRQIHLDC